MKIKNKIIIAITRSEYAYAKYIENKYYYQAIRIYRANAELYILLEKYLFKCDESEKEDVLNFLFHIEDWTEQFNKFKIKNNPELEDKFSFERLSESIPYPKKFINKLKGIV